MIKLKRTNNNLIIGILVGFILVAIIMVEKSWIMALMFANGSNINTILAEFVAIVMSILVFAFVVYRFSKIKAEKLSIYFISSIMGSLFITVEIFLLFVKVFQELIKKIVESPEFKRFIETDIGIFILNNFISLNFILLVGVFLICFALFINRKVKYIKYITKEIKQIESEGFGRTVAVKGNDELSELSQSINRMSTKLKEKIEKERKIEQNKNELITNVSHDLRTPLTSISGYVDLLKKNGFTDIDKFNEYIDVVERRTKGLNCLINELFEYTKLNNHDIKLNYDTIDIVSLISHIVDEYYCIFEKSGLKLRREILDKEILMTLDVEKIVRVLQNLLSNADKYSIKNSSVVLCLTEDDHNVYILVSNRTSEIDENNLPNIFSRFYKGDTSRSDYDSSGLGLSIAKRIVELHRGSISADLNGDEITIKISLPKQSI